MTYVPTVPTPPTPPSPRTRELASLLTKVLEEYRKTHPAVTSGEIRAAFKLAYMAGRDGKQAVTVGLAVGVAILLGVVAVGLFVAESGGEAEWVTAMPVLVIVVIILLLVVVRIRSR